VGLVEPLGFPRSSLRYKRDAVKAIAAIGERAVFKIVHDTFHHAIAAESEIFPSQTGLVHISGVDQSDIPVPSIRDSHRVLVGPQDRINNIEQIRGLLVQGYSGFFSFEPFAESVHAEPDLRRSITESIAFIEAELA
jgi:2-keto-myo-inositol isomerase